MPKHDARNRSLTNPKPLCYITLFVARVSKLSYVAYLIFCKAGVSVPGAANQVLRSFRQRMIPSAWLQSYAMCVNMIFATRYIFKVLKAIVEFNTVYMIDFKSRRAWPNERKQNQTMNRANYNPRIHAKMSGSIVPDGFIEAKNVTGYAKPAPSFITAHSAKIRDGIHGLITRDGKPPFRRVRICDSHDLNLRYGLGLWSGSYLRRNLMYGPLVF